MRKLLALILTAAATTVLLSGCSKPLPMLGVWEARSGATLEITSDKWIAREGPMQVTLTYTVEKTENDKVVISLDDGSGKGKKARATLTVEGNKLRITDNNLYGGTWTRK